MLVAYGIRRDGSRHLLAFLRSQGEGQADWEALLQDLYRRGLEGRSLGLILTDGCAGLAAAIRTVYPRVRHQRCWVHKMAEHFRESAEARLRRSEGRSPGHLSGREPGAGGSCLSHLPLALGSSVLRDGPAAAGGSARVVVVFRFPPSFVAQTAHHQRDRALLCRSPT